MLQTVCQSLSDTNQVVRSASLFALGQFSEHLQVSQHSIMYTNTHIWSTLEASDQSSGPQQTLMNRSI